MKRIVIALATIAALTFTSTAMAHGPWGGPHRGPRFHHHNHWRGPVYRQPCRPVYRPIYQPGFAVSYGYPVVGAPFAPVAPVAPIYGGGSGFSLWFGR